jgi:serine/threonine-protein kinase
MVAGRYRLLRRLGEGGMGVVWVAHSTALDVDVALKVLKRELAGTDAVERMAREARTAAQLGHPAMVRVLDFGTSEQGEPFLAMELLEGEELHTRLRREQRLPAATAISLLLPIIDGLGTAHEKGIVHRDIKPENIFIAQDSQRRVQPKVLDFGIAKLSNERAPSRLTEVGAIMGSPFYLSPEQAEGLDDIDLRCDIWAIGVVLYELVTGAPPFAANNYNALIRSILRDSPKPITEQGAGDAQLWSIIERCLKKDREDRWANMWEVGEALALWLFERGVRVDASARSLKHHWLDGTITGVKMLVTSVAPEADLPSVIVDDSLHPPRPDRLAQTHLRPRRRPRKMALSLLIALGAAFSVLALAMVYRFRAASQASGTPGAEVSRPATVAQGVIPAAPSLTASAAAAVVEPATTAADAAPSVSAAPASAAPASAKAAPAAEPKPRPKAPSRPPSSTAAPARARHNTEFGF